MSIVEDLSRQILLENLNPEEIKVIASAVEAIKFSTNDPIFTEGQHTKGVYLINYGEVEISRKLPIDLKTKMLITLRNVQHCCDIRKTPYGWKQVFAKLIEGFFFGELAIVENLEKHTIDAIALEDTEVYLIRTNKFNEMCDANPHLLIKIMKTIAKTASKNVRNLDRQLLKILIGY
ncbi:MAG: cyclic nucleotide-binding domain-containing protein [Nitrospirae bacterium]|nr:cyclic nucleotide-binding domain-containing protein [Nitrospirota bacterium]